MNCGQQAIRHQLSIDKLRNCSLAATLLLVAWPCLAQEAAPAQRPSTQNPTQPSGPTGKQMAVLPAGTKLPLALQRPISTETARPGDMAYLLTTSPVTVGDQMVVPPETFVQGQIVKITIPGIDRDGELHLQSANLVFANGYTVAIPYDFVVRLDRRWIVPEPPGPGRMLALGAAVAAPVAGALIGGLTSRHSPPPLTPPVPGQPLTLPDLGNPVKGAAIGGAIGLGVTIPVTFAILRHQHDFFIEGGLPTEMTLERPLALDEDRIAAAVPPLGSLLPPPPPMMRTCYTPGTPGTPDIVIPGTPTIPGTPPVGDMPGTPDIPGTPDTIIPGSPAIPGRAYPCP